MKDKEQRTGDGGTEELKDRNSGIKQQKRGHGTVDKGEKGGWETGDRSRKTGYRGRVTRNRKVIQRKEDAWETMNRDVRLGTADGRQE
jgi:hypothetical protein